MEKLELIYTFKSRPQRVVSCSIDLAVLSALQSKKDFAKFALCKLFSDERQRLVKISSCLHLNKKNNQTIPQWFEEVDGKLFFRNGQLL